MSLMRLQVVQDELVTMPIMMLARSPFQGFLQNLDCNHKYRSEHD